MKRLSEFAGIAALVLLIIAGSFAFGWSMHHVEQQSTLLKFRIVRVVNADDGPETLDGTRPPYTVLRHETYVQKTMPGVVGNVGDEIYHTDPRQKSESTMLP